MKCKKCKMDIPNGAKICPYCNSKQGGIGCVGVIVAIVIVGVFISIVANIGKGVRMAQESAASRASASSSSTISEEPYSNIKQLISTACRGVGINPSEIKNIMQLDNWEGGERYQFAFSGYNYTADLNEDGTLNNISIGTNVLYSDGEVKIRYMNGFLVRDDGGTTDNDACEVNGTVLNITGGDCSYVQIDVGYYDDNGVKITSGLDNVLNLKKGEQWRFKAYGFGSGIKRYKIEEISWY